MVHNYVFLILIFLYTDIDNTRFTSALAAAILLGVALVISLIGFVIVAIILLIKSKIKLQTGTMAVTSIQGTPSENYTSIQHHNENIITTNENIAYVVHSTKTDTD